MLYCVVVYCVVLYCVVWHWYWYYTTDLAVEDDVALLVELHGRLRQVALGAEHPLLDELARALLDGGGRGCEWVWMGCEQRVPKE